MIWIGTSYQKELIGAGYGKMFSFYALMDERNDRPLLCPR